MAESYVDLLTEQEGIPAKPFDPVWELKRLRQRLALRMQMVQSPKEDDVIPFRIEITEKETVLPEIAGSVSLEAVVKKVGHMKKTLACWQFARLRKRSRRAGMFRGNRPLWNRRRVSLVVNQYLVPPPHGSLETVNAALTTLGIIGIVFGVLSFIRGWESDLSLGSLVCVSGLSVMTIGLAGRFLASHVNCEK